MLTKGTISLCSLKTIQSKNFANFFVQLTKREREGILKWVLIEIWWVFLCFFRLAFFPLVKINSSQYAPGRSCYCKNYYEFGFLILVAKFFMWDLNLDFWCNSFIQLIKIYNNFFKQILLQSPLRGKNFF